MEDHSKTNPGLHYLYVTTAMQHLVVLRTAIKKLSRADLNWYGPVDALITERAKLLKEDAAYQEAAWRILAGHIVKDRPLDDMPEGGIAYPDIENLCIYDTVSESWVEKPAPGQHVSTQKLADALGTDAGTLSSLLQNGEPGFIDTPEKEKETRQKTQLKASSESRAERTRQAQARRIERKRKASGLWGLWTFDKDNPEEKYPTLLEVTFHSERSIWLHAQKRFAANGYDFRLTNPSGAWIVDSVVREHCKKR